MSGIKKLLGAKIARLRKERGLSQMKFAEMLGISINALGIIETGVGFLTAETLEKILDNLEITPDELFSFGETKTKEEIKKRIFELISQIKDKEKLNAIYSFVKNII